MSAHLCLHHVCHDAACIMQRASCQSKSDSRYLLFNWTFPKDSKVCQVHQKRTFRTTGAGFDRLNNHLPHVTQPTTSRELKALTVPPSPQPFYSPFPGPSGWASARRKLLGLRCKGRLTEANTPTIRHSIRTNPPPPSPHLFTGRMPFLPANQQCQSVP